MKKILFPTDCSHAAENALKYALKLAEKFSYSIDILRVYQAPFRLDHDLPPEIIQARIEKEAQLIQGEVASFLKPYQSNCMGEVMVINGTHFAQEIVNKAEEKGYDLIVMGMKGQRNVLDKMMGSVTTHTMRNAPCPVLAIPTEATFSPIESIAYATDLEPDDKHAVAQLMVWAGLLGAQVHFVHVETAPDIGVMEDRVRIDNYPFEYVDFTIVNNPSVPKGLAQYMQLKEIDVLALFAPQRGLWERLFHTSLTKKVAFQSEIPLLVFHH